MDIKRDAGGAQTLGELLLEAREAKELTLDDIAAKTQVRKFHLSALEQGRYDTLPEEAYTKTYVRLYAQAVGLDPLRLLHIYRQEQRPATSSSVSTPSRSASTGATDVRKPKVVPAAEAPTEPRVERSAETAAETTQEAAFDDFAAEERGFGPRFSAFGRFATTLMLVAGLVLLALWGFNTLLFQPTTPTVTSGVPVTSTDVTTTGAPAGAAQPAAAPSVAASDLILLSVNTTPPGAEVRVDGLAFDTVSPILDAPVRAGENRVVQVSLPGYESVEQPLDLTRDRNLNISLSPASRVSEVAAGDIEAASAGAADRTSAPAAEGEVIFAVSAPAWLEVYSGSARGEGERLYYGTATSGETLTFDLPVYVHTGNGGGVNLAVDGEDRGALGADGQVTGRALP